MASEIMSASATTVTSGVKPHQEAVPELALACAGVLSEPIRDRAARSGLHLWDGPVDPG